MIREEVEVKMSDREALEWALEGLGSALPSDADQFAFHDALKTTMAAARERLAQLPEKCVICNGDGFITYGDDGNARDCEICHGSGRVYPAELVKLFEQTLMQCWKQHATFEAMALTLLDALTGETP